MRKIYIRCGMSPFDNFDAAHIIANDHLGGNAGNLLLTFGVMRALMTDDTVFEANYYKWDKTDIARINEECDCFVIPLTDAFRKDFVQELNGLTSLIKKLKIPCVVIGAGLHSPFEPDFSAPFPFDEDVKKFVSAVLQKSDCIGVRGDITGAYLKKLGFREGKHFEIIGCPSMYTYGSKLNVRQPALTQNSRVCFNLSPFAPKNVMDFMMKESSAFSNRCFIPQTTGELRLMYLGVKYNHEKCENYPEHISHPLFAADKARFFLNAPTWLNYMRNSDFSFGSELHGNIAAVISGTPSLMIPHDARMREIAEYHSLTCLPAYEITESSNLPELCDRLDFKLPVKYHKQNFKKYIKFLNRNGLEHIFENGIPESAPLDEAISLTALQPPVIPSCMCSFSENNKRLNSYIPLLDSKLSENKKFRIDLKNEPDLLKNAPKSQNRFTWHSFIKK